MARIKWVSDRLENWARWCSSQERGGLGYPSQSAFAKLGGRARRAEAAIPLLSLDAEETDRAVRSLIGTHSHLYLVLQLVYAKNMPRDRVARQLARTEDTIKRHLEEADHVLARWFQEQEQAREARRQMLMTR